MLIKAFFLILLAGIVVSLFSGLFFLHRDQDGSGRMLQALKIRIGLSVLLFVLLILAWLTGLIEPHSLMQR